MDLSAQQDALLELGRSFGDRLATIKARRPDVLTKSGLMLGLGETDDEVVASNWSAATDTSTV
jgi:biotin synthase-like enzyme